MSSQALPADLGNSGGGVIHDIGYRPYSGSRLGEGSIARALLANSYANAFGWGRSLTSKLLPVVLVALYLLPAPIIVAVAVFTEATELGLSYSEYFMSMFFVPCVFAAAQAPVLFSRDQRCGSISVYLARPLRSFTYALMRWLGLVLAVFTLLLLPLIVLYVGALLAGMDISNQSKPMLQAIGLNLFMALMLSGICAVVSAWAIKKGIAVVISISVLIIGMVIVNTVQALADEQGATRLAQIIPVLSPIVLYQGAVSTLTSVNISAAMNPGGSKAGIFYIVVGLLLTASCLFLLRLRYRKVASR